MKKLFLFMALFFLLPDGAWANCYIEVPEGVEGPMRAPNGRGRGRWYVMNTHENSRIHSAPTPGADQCGNLPFGEVFYVLHHLGSRLLLGQYDDGGEATYIGWVDEDALLTGNHCRTNPKTGTSDKMLLRNNWQVGEKGNEITVRSGPGTHYDVRKTSTLMNIRYIYDSKTVKEEGQDATYFLLGETEIWQPENSDTIVGWVRRDNGFVWSTRLAVELNKENLDPTLLRSGKEGFQRPKPGTRGPTQFFWRQQDLLASLSPEGNGESLELRGIEDGAQSWPHNLSRFPVLGRPESLRPSQLGLAAEGASHIKEGQMEAIPVGYIQNIKEQTRSPGAPAQEVSRLEVEPKVAALSERLAQGQDLDIVFVIDATESMQPYFPTVIQALDGFISAPGFNDRRTRFALQLYRDDSEGKGISEWVGFRSASQIKGALEGARAYSRATDPDTTEALFYGMIDGIERAKGEFRPHSYKAMILVGHTGDHRRLGQRPEDVSRALTLQDGGGAQVVRLFTIHVDPDQGAQADARKIFKSDIQSIMQLQAKNACQSLFDRYLAEGRDPKTLNQVKAGCTEAIGAYYAVDNQGKDPLEGTMQAIYKQLSAAKEHNTSGLRAARAWVRGESRKENLLERYGIRATHRALELIGDDIQNEALISGEQLCDEGWFLSHDPYTGEAVSKNVIFISLRDLEDLVGTLNRLLDRVADPRDQNLPDLWRQVLQDAVGDQSRYQSLDPDDIPYSNYLRDLLGVETGGLLAKSPRELRALIEGHSEAEILEYEFLWAQLQYKREILEHLKREDDIQWAYLPWERDPQQKILKLTQINRVEEGEKAGRPKFKARFYHIAPSGSDSQKMAWIAQEVLP